MRGLWKLHIEAIPKANTANSSRQVVSMALKTESTTQYCDDSCWLKTSLGFFCLKMQSWVPISVYRGSSNTTAEKCLQAVYRPYLTQPQHSIPDAFTFALPRGNNALHYPSIHFLPLTFMLWSYKMLLCVSDGRYDSFLKASLCLMCPAKPSQVKNSFAVHEYLNKTWNKSLNLKWRLEAFTCSQHWQIVGNLIWPLET